MDTALYYLDMDNSTDKFDGWLSIDEFSKKVHIPVNRLRYYDKINLFVPASRILDPDSKKIRYSPVQITEIGFVRVMMNIGVKTKTILDHADKRTPESTAKLISSQVHEAARKARSLDEAGMVVTIRNALINEGMNATETEMTVVQKPVLKMVLGDSNNFKGKNGFYDEFARFCDDLSRWHFSVDYPVGGLFDSMEDFIANPSQPQRFFSLDPRGSDVRPAGLYLTGYTRGYYGETNGLEHRMAYHAKAQGIDFVGPVYNIYLFTEVCLKDPSQYLLQASVPVVETYSVTSSKNKNGND